MGIYIHNHTWEYTLIIIVIDANGIIQLINGLNLTN